MESSFTWILSNGKEARLEAKYDCVMRADTLYADGYNIPTEPKPETAGNCNMVLYVDGQRIDSCYNPSFWQLIDIKDTPKTGVRKIWGLKAGMMPDVAARYEDWLAKLIEAGTSDEVKEYRAAEKAKEDAKEIAAAKRLIEKAEKQREIPPRAEAERQMKRYNDINNEGGEGFVPYIINREEYEAAKCRLAALIGSREG